MNETNTVQTPVAVTPWPTLEHNKVSIALVETETKAKEGKAPFKYYAVDFDSYIPSIPENFKPDETMVVTMSLRESHQWAWFKSVNALYTFAVVSEMFAVKANTNIAAAQKDAGKDTLTMPEKLDALKAYVAADFGANSKGGGAIISAAFKALKEVNTKQGDINIRMMKAGAVLSNSGKHTPAEITAACAEMALASAELTALNTAATK